MFSSCSPLACTRRARGENPWLSGITTIVIIIATIIVTGIIIAHRNRGENYTSCRAINTRKWVILYASANAVEVIDTEGLRRGLPRVVQYLERNYIGVNRSYFFLFRRTYRMRDFVEILPGVPEWNNHRTEVVAVQA